MLSNLAIFQNIGAPEIIIILIVALLLFGRRLPEVARNLGKGITEFKRGVRDASEEVKQELDKAADETEAERPAKEAHVPPATSDDASKN